MKRRIAQCVVLLFCSSVLWGQVKVEHSIFKDRTRTRTIPSFVSSTGSSIGMQRDPNDGNLQLDLSQALTSGYRWNEESTQSDSAAAAGSNGLNSDTSRSTKSPGLAILMSAIIPGSGQIYVHRYFTIPLIWGFGYYFAKAWNDQNKRYVYYRDLFSASVRADTVNHQGNGVYQSNRDFYRDDRDRFAFYLAITYVLNILDAYVGASLYGFDVSNNLGGSAAIRFRIPLE